MRVALKNLTVYNDILMLYITIKCILLVQCSTIVFEISKPIILPVFSLNQLSSNSMYL